MAKFYPENPLFYQGKSASWADILAAAQTKFSTLIRPQRRIAFIAENYDEALQAVVLAYTELLDFVILDHARYDTALKTALGDSGFDVLLMAGAEYQENEQTQATDSGRVTVLTSGTTGVPKQIQHSWDTLNTYQRIEQRGKTIPPSRWACPYQIGSYAWYQMICLALFNDQQGLFLFDVQADLQAQFEQMIDFGVTSISATPTFWRYILMNVAHDTLAQLPMKQLSLGGEIVDQVIIDQLGGIFAQARVSHIYASSEAGAAIVVNDGKAGFPEDWLNGETLKVEDNRLYIQSQFSSDFYKTNTVQWIDTADNVEIRDGRVFIMGRDSDKMINVGGQKAYPADIEACLMQHPDVVWCAISAKRAPLVGYLPIASIVLQAKPDNTADMEQSLTQHCLALLPEYAVPRLWTFLDTIPLQQSMKTVKN